MWCAGMRLPLSALRSISVFARRRPEVRIPLSSLSMADSHVTSPTPIGGSVPRGRGGPPSSRRALPANRSGNPPNGSSGGPTGGSGGAGPEGGRPGGTAPAPSEIGTRGGPAPPSEARRRLRVSASISASRSSVSRVRGPAIRRRSSAMSSSIRPTPPPSEGITRETSSPASRPTATPRALSGATPSTAASMPALEDASRRAPARPSWASPTGKSAPTALRAVPVSCLNVGAAPATAPRPNTLGPTRGASMRVAGSTYDASRAI